MKASLVHRVLRSENIEVWQLVNNFLLTYLLKGKDRKVDLYSDYRQYNSTTKRSDVDHKELPANTPHLPFLRISIR